jgi:hypothetical protein
VIDDRVDVPGSALHRSPGRLGGCASCRFFLRAVVH